MTPAPPEAWPPVTIQLPLFNEMYVVDRLVEAVCRMDYPKDQLEVQILDDSTDETQDIARLAAQRYAAQGFDVKYIHRDDRGGYKAGALDAALKVARGRFVAIFDADFVPSADFLKRTVPHFADPQGGHGAGALDAPEPGLLAADQGAVDPARRPLRARARRAQPVGPLLQFQRDGRHLAARGDRRRRRLAARHAHRGPRPQLPHAAQGLAVRLPAGPRGAGRGARRDERLQVAAAPLGEGVHPDLPQAAAAHPPVRRAARGEGRGVHAPDGQLQLPAHGRPVPAHLPVDGDPVQHGLVRDAAHRRAALLRRDGVGGQLLHRLAAGTVPARPGRRG